MTSPFRSLVTSRKPCVNIGKSSYLPNTRKVYLQQNQESLSHNVPSTITRKSVRITAMSVYFDLLFLFDDKTGRFSYF